MDEAPDGADGAAVAMVDKSRARFLALKSLSMDEGFHSPANQQALQERVERVVLPKKPSSP